MCNRSSAFCNTTTTPEKARQRRGTDLARGAPEDALQVCERLWCWWHTSCNEQHDRQRESPRRIRPCRASATRLKIASVRGVRGLLVPAKLANHDVFVHLVRCVWPFGPSGASAQSGTPPLQSAAAWPKKPATRSKSAPPSSNAQASGEYTTPNCPLVMVRTSRVTWPLVTQRRSRCEAPAVSMGTSLLMQHPKAGSTRGPAAEGFSRERHRTQDSMGASSAPPAAAPPSPPPAAPPP